MKNYSLYPLRGFESEDYVFYFSTGIIYISMMIDILNFQCMPSSMYLTISGYSQRAFREELVRQLSCIDEHEEVPVYIHNRTAPPHASHMPQHTGDVRRNCKVCYVTTKKEVKSSWKCCDPQCSVHLCLNRDRNCFARWHSPDADLLQALFLEE